jgi:diguanylate cyclase
MPILRRLATRARAVGGWRAICLVLAGCYLVSVLTRHNSGYSLAADGVLYTAVYVACALCCLLRARRAGASATIWRLLAAGIASYSFGWGAAAHWMSQNRLQPIPSIADVGWLGLYPLAFVAIARMMQRLRTDRSSVLPLLDAVVAGLGAAALCASIVLPYLAADPHAKWTVTVTDAAYPCGDMLLLGALVATLVVARFAVPPTVWVMSGAVVVLVLGDSIYLTGVASGSFHWGSAVGLSWLLAVVAVSMCAGAGFTARPSFERPSSFAQAVPGIATLSSLAILLFRANGPLQDVVASLAALAIAVAVVRLMLSYHEARALADSRQLAQTDELTGLVNRRGFQSRARDVLAANSGPLAVLLVDLDGFKDINDALGHPTGDELLRALGGRLSREAKHGALIGRIGGDEFAVLTDDAEHGANEVAARLLVEIRRPFELQGMELRIDASIGIASAPHDGVTLDDLLRHADIAMYRAKARHLGVLRYSADAGESRGALLTMAELRRAVENDPSQLVLHYQPKVHLMSGRLAGVEALVRWQHPERGLLMPGEFLPLAEKARLMGLLTERVLERAMTEMASWKGQLGGQPVAVNLPAEAVGDPTLVERVAALLAATNTPAGRLHLEITEDFLMADLTGARIVLEKLRALGIEISIDDYGTGYSSLAYLRDLPVDELKLDRAFVQPILADRRAAAIVRSTIDLAHSLGLRMVAEGIEDVDTWHRLLAMGCDIGQGYLFGRPQPAVDLEAALASPTNVFNPAAANSLVWQATTTSALRSMA